ncbi:FadR/GntR family transcriptional regulator [Sphingomonas naphthae]|uniref:FadR/GntR family transcriptional regulator n=1 Tax=Sphingomonas naphthae TaxID=1813468 RepID=A0ABY7TMB7_9SPHN|nr:FadR/GntR family transcriptional regulator [Sphingomonas naphthae]WCT74153.1 FadR/GntR family transcriptional regulator [Sphingomonas naphthae]
MASNFTSDDRVEGRESRPERIASILRQRIATHDLAVGARLPSENALASHFGVSRAAVREAIARLKVEGLVETRQGSGAFVRSPETGGASPADGLTRASLDSLLDLIEVRRVTEAEMAARAAVMRSEQQMQAIDAALDRLSLAEQSGGDGVAEDRAFHTSIANASGNIYWRKLIDAFARHISIAMSVTRCNEGLSREFAQQVAIEHRELRDAIAARDPDRARAAATRHMEMSAQRTLSADRDFWSKGGAPVVKLPHAR